MEGPAVWILDGSPMPARRLVFAKCCAAWPIVAAYPACIGALGGVILELPLFLWVVTTLLCAVVASSLSAYAVGRGAVAPLFDAANVSELAMGPGALSTMASSVAISALTALAAGMAGAVLRFGAGPSRGPLVLALLAVPVSLALWRARQAVTAGAAAFVTRREDDRAGPRPP